jgi:hypothetical protein
VLSLIHTLSSSLEHVLSLLSLLCLYQSLSDKDFQRCRSLNSCFHVLTGRQLSHNSLNFKLVLLITLWQSRKHLYPVSPLVCVRNLLQPLPINDRCLLPLLSNESTCYSILHLEGSINYGFLWHKSCQVTTDLSLLSIIILTHNLKFYSYKFFLNL